MYSLEHIYVCIYVFHNALQHTFLVNNCYVYVSSVWRVLVLVSTGEELFVFPACQVGVSHLVNLPSVSADKWVNVTVASTWAPPRPPPLFLVLI